MGLKRSSTFENLSGNTSVERKKNFYEIGVTDFQTLTNFVSWQTNIVKHIIWTSSSVHLNTQHWKVTNAWKAGSLSEEAQAL